MKCFKQYLRLYANSDTPPGTIDKHGIEFVRIPLPMQRIILQASIIRERPNQIRNYLNDA